MAVKKILCGIIAVSLLSLCSCAGTTKKVIDSQLQDVITASSSDTSSEEAVPTSSSAETMPSGVDSTTGMPGQGFIGVWSTDEAKTNQILIYEITPVAVTFNTGVNGLFGFDATAMLSDGEIIFGDGISPGYSGPEGVRGKLEFSDNSVTVIYDSFGSLPDSEYYEKSYTFTIKDENSDSIISEHIDNLQN